MQFFDENWGEVVWTSWVPFANPLEFKQFPTSAGMYRVRAVNGQELFYVGETGRNLRERLNDLRRNTMMDIMPYNDPHTAAPSLWAWKDAEGIDFECSVVSVSFARDREDARKLREGFEFFLLWQYRLEFGSSTRCNHGRFHPRYKKSTDRKQGIRGYRLDEHEEDNLAGGPSLSALQDIAEPLAPNWMGLPWTNFCALSMASIKRVPLASGVYKIVDMMAGELLYIGETRNLQQRLRSHAGKSWNGSVPDFSYVQMPDDTPTYQLHEVENDLIGGFYKHTRMMPKFQLINHR